MKKITLTVLTALFLVPATTQAYQQNTMLRGGFGFLFGDNNSFLNPGQFAVSHGLAAEISYTRTSVSETQGVAPSIVYGNGNFGLGVAASRTATSSLTSGNSTDVVDAGLGVSLIKERLTFGVEYARNISGTQSNGGVVDTTMTLSGPQHMGPALGIGFGTTVNGFPQTQTANLALGYRFKTNTTFEVGAIFNDISNTNNVTGTIDATFGGQVVYLGLGYRYFNVSHQNGGAARLGFILGRYIDLSALATSIIASGADVLYGVTLRATF